MMRSSLFGAHAGTGGGVAGHGIGRSDKGIRPVVDVQMDALRAFEEHALAFVPRLFKLGRHVRQMRDDARRDGHHFIEHGIHGQSVDAVQCREQDILFLEAAAIFALSRSGSARSEARTPTRPTLSS